MRALRVFALACSLVASAPAAASAQDAPPPTASAVRTSEPAADPPTRPTEPSAPLNLRPSRELETKPAPTGMGFGYKLTAIAAVLGGAYLLLRKRKPESGGGRASQPIRVVTRTSIGVRTEIVVIEVEGQRLVLGVTPSQVSTLSVLSDEPRLALQEAEDSPVSEPPPRPAPPAPARGPHLEESLNRLIAGARAELEETHGSSARGASGAGSSGSRDGGWSSPRVVERGATPAPKGEVAPRGDAPLGRTKGTRGREGASSLEGQVRGLHTKRG